MCLLITLFCLLFYSTGWIEIVSAEMWRCWPTKSWKCSDTFSVRPLSTVVSLLISSAFHDVFYSLYLSFSIHRKEKAEESLRQAEGTCITNYFKDKIRTLCQEIKANLILKSSTFYSFKSKALFFTIMNLLWNGNVPWVLKDLNGNIL